MNDRESLLVLNAVPDLGSLRIHNLLQSFKLPAQIFKAVPEDLMQVSGISRRIAVNIINWHKCFDLKKELELIAKNRIEIITILDDNYPRLLREIHDPPVVLYLKGCLPQENERFLAVVGARRASYYGLNTARKLAKQLAERGFIVVSGLARGVDTAGHEGALQGQGRTIAVFGCGLDRIYPPENKNLAEKIIAQGAIVTEYPLGTPPNKFNFPKRNRIISGLSVGVVIIEAGNRSGSLITARLAAEQGREVFSIPGRIDVPTSTGTNMLIKEGAKPVIVIEDILEELHYSVS